MNSVVFDRAKLKRLKRAYKAAHENGKEVFIFEGREILTSYAKYMIEYLNRQLGEK